MIRETQPAPTEADYRALCDAFRGMRRGAETTRTPQAAAELLGPDDAVDRLTVRRGRAWRSPVDAERHLQVVFAECFEPTGDGSGRRRRWRRK